MINLKFPKKILTSPFYFLTFGKENASIGRYIYMAKAIVSSKGQITIPKTIREITNIKTGDKIDFRFEEGVVKLIPLSKTVSEVFGILSRESQKPLSIEQMNSRLKNSFKNKEV